MNQRNVFFAYCEYGTVYSVFNQSMIELILGDTRGVLGGVNRCYGAYIAQNRNNAVDDMLAVPQLEWLLFVDYDIKFTAQDVYALLDAADPVERPIVGGLYVVAGPNFGLTTTWFTPHEGLDYRGRVVPEGPGELHQLTACGMGFTVIHRSVLEAVRAAHVEADPWHCFGHDILVNETGGLERTSEDVTFCRRATALGFTVWGTSDAHVGHLKARTLRADGRDEWAP